MGSFIGTNGPGNFFFLINLFLFMEILFLVLVYALTHNLSNGDVFVGKI